MKIELSHDLLAKKIHEKASTEDKMLMRIRKFIQDRFSHFEDSKSLLAVRDINYISPYLDKLTLEPHETRFIQRSKERIIRIAIVITLMVFAIVGVAIYFVHDKNRTEQKNSARMAAQIARYQEINEHAQQLSSALTASRAGLDATQEELHLALLALQERNDTLVNAYATYKVKKDFSMEQLESDLKIAQSSKLSELAASLVSLNKPYAFRLAAKAWALNPENEQAMDALYRLASVSTSKGYSKQKVYSIVKQYKSKWGSIQDKEFNAIFQPQNKVQAQKDIAAQVQQTIKAPPPPSSPMQQVEDFDKKIKVQRAQIQESVQQINMEQQRIRQEATELLK